MQKNDINGKKKRFFRTALFSVCFILPLSACSKEIDYYEFVSESRSNILLAQTETLDLRVYAVEKEQPYAADGIKRETSARTEIRLTAPSGDKVCTIAFSVNGKDYGGEMSFDNVKTEYYYFCTLDASALQTLDCTIDYGGETTLLQATTVRTENTLTPNGALKTLCETEKELFSALTDEYGFAGEIHLRLIYEEHPYYYLGVIDRNGNTTAYLMNGETGKLLAKRES
ncbi:MAG: hypothetical protein IJB34_03230 [Clostridia bacterium]|nr:hypothetical protein [Clostridia bacterium]